MTDDASSGMFGQLKALIDDNIPGRGTASESKRDSPTRSLRLPTDGDVVDAAVDAVVSLRQSQNLSNHPEIDEAEAVPVELEMDEPNLVVERMQDALAGVHDELLEELDRVVRMDENSVSGSDVDTMLYVVKENAGEHGDVSILGGAESLLRNLAAELDLTPDETEVVVAAHGEAARQNGYDRHNMLDTTAFVPTPTDSNSADGD